MYRDHPMPRFFEMLLHRRHVKTSVTNGTDGPRPLFIGPSEREMISFFREMQTSRRTHQPVKFRHPVTEPPYIIRKWRRHASTSGQSSSPRAGSTR